MNVWTSKDLANALRKKEPIIIIDVRDSTLFESGHIEGAEIYNFPYRKFVGEPQMFLEKLPLHRDILVVCARGNSSKVVASGLSESGYQAKTLEGGMAAWRNHYEKKEVVADENLSITQFQRVGRGCLSYFVKIAQEGFVIDPSRHIQQYVEQGIQLNTKPTAIFDTHAHADHLSGGRVLADHWKVPYFLHPYDAIHPIDLLSATFPYSPLWEGKTFGFEIVHIPGHTLGNCAFILNHQYLFSGDSIFIHSIARPDLGGRTESWTDLHYHSLKKLLTLPDKLIVLPAHFSQFEEATDQGIFAKSLGELKETNKGLQMAQKSLEEFRDYILSNLPQFPEEYMDIKRVNLSLLVVDEEEATHLETGKNICALK